MRDGASGDRLQRWVGMLTMGFRSRARSVQPNDTVEGRIVGALNIPAGADWATLIKKVQHQVGKPIYLLPTDDHDLKPTGFVLDGEDAALVFYRTWDSPLYQQHSVFHELGHILLHHEGCRVLDDVPAEVVSSKGIGEGLMLAKARGHEVNPDELSAEAIAYALAQRVVGTSPASIDAFGL